MIQAPLELFAIAAADALEYAIGLFPDAVLEPVGIEDRNERKGKKESADKGEGHGVGHGMEKPSGGAGEGIDREIAGDDDGDGVKDGAVDIASGGENDVVDFIFLAVAEAELAVDVFDHDDRAVDDDPEVDGADREKVCGFTGGMEKNESEKKSERHSERGNDGGSDADKEKDEDDKNERHAAKEVPFDGVGSDLDEIAAVVVRADFDVGGQKIAIDFDCFLLDTLENILRLLAAAHEDDAFDSVVVILFIGFVLEAENAQARGNADNDAADVFDADGHAVAAAADHDFADVFRGFDEPEAADVIKLAALRVKAAAGIGVVGREGVQNLNDGQVIVVELNGVEQDVILHGGAAEAGVIGHARDAAIGALNDPGLEGVQLHRRTIGTFDDVAIDEAARAEERSHARGDAGGQSGVAEAFENDLASEVSVGAVLEGEDDVRESVKRNGTHHLEVRRAVHGQLERKSGEALDFFGGMAGPLGDELNHGRRKIGIGVDGHAAERFGSGDDHQQGDDQDEEALAQGELDYVMDHRDFSRPRLPLVL